MQLMSRLIMGNLAWRSERNYSNILELHILPANIHMVKQRNDKRDMERVTHPSKHLRPLPFPALQPNQILTQIPASYLHQVLTLIPVIFPFPHLTKRNTLLHMNLLPWKMFLVPKRGFIHVLLQQIQSLRKVMMKLEMHRRDGVHVPFQAVAPTIISGLCIACIFIIQENPLCKMGAELLLVGLFDGVVLCSNGILQMLPRL